MEQKAWTTQKTVGYLLAANSVIGFFANLIYLCFSGTIKDSFTTFNLIAMCMYTVFFLLTALLKNKIMQYFQGIIIIGIGIVAIFDLYDSIWGTALFILFIIIGFEYGWFTKRLHLKIVLVMILYVSLITASIIIDYGFEYLANAVGTLSASATFVLLLLLIHKKRIHQVKLKNKSDIEKIRAEKSLLISEISDRTKRLEQLNSVILLYEEKHKAVNLSEITPAEMRVLEALCMYRETDKDLGKRLNITEGTVGVHLQKIRDKLGVDNKLELIELCRNNFD